MIELNLLPEEIKKKRRRIELPEIPLVPITVGVIGALVIIQILLAGFIFFSKKELVVLNKKNQDLAPKKREIKNIKRGISDRTRKVGAIEGLIKEQLNWSRLLNELSDSITPNVWFTNLSYDEKVERKTVPSRASAGARRPAAKPKTKVYKIRTLTLIGSASGRGEATTEHIARFIRSLKGNKDFFREFTDIELVSIKKGRMAGEDVMNFKLVCKFKP